MSTPASRKREARPQVIAAATCALTALCTLGAIGAIGAPPTRAASAPTSSTPARTNTVRADSKPVSTGNPFRTGRTLLIAHAGGDALFPENTLLAFERSTALGSEVIDIDVQMTADNVLIALHDRTLDRTTNGTGSVHTMTLPQIQRFDAGYRFSSQKKFPFRGKGLTIPTVEALLKRFPTMLVTLDLKDQRTSLARPVCELVTRLRRIDTVYVGSDSNAQVVEFRRLCPQLRTSGTSAERTLMRAARDAGDTTFKTRQLVSQPRFIGTDGRPRVTAESLAFSHALNIAVLTWIVDNPDDMRALIKLGVDGIYTRRPDVLAKVLAESR